MTVIVTREWNEYLRRDFTAADKTINMHIEIKDKTTQEVFSDFYCYLKIEFYSKHQKSPEASSRYSRFLHKVRESPENYTELIKLNSLADVLGIN